MPAENRNELYDLQERIARLSVPDQLSLIARVADRIRRGRFTDHEAQKREWAEFVEEYVANDGHVAPYPIPPEYDITPRGEVR